VELFTGSSRSVADVPYFLLGRPER